MKKDPQEALIDALGSLLEDASKAQEQKMIVRVALCLILLMSLCLGYVHFSFKELKCCANFFAG